jgi:hypothetical protein
LLFVASFVLMPRPMRRPAMLPLLLLTACGSGAPSHVDLARARWAEAKADCRTYSYTLTRDSFAGTRTRTSFEFVDDVATKRMYVRAHRDFNGGMAANFIIDESWVETGVEVGTHQDVEPPRTMEKLYDDCARDVLSQDPAKNTITFSADARGAIQACFFVPSGCADDCAMGHMVTGFACGPLDTTTPRP